MTLIDALLTICWWAIWLIIIVFASIPFHWLAYYIDSPIERRNTLKVLGCMLACILIASLGLFLWKNPHLLAPWFGALKH